MLNQKFAHRSDAWIFYRTPEECLDSSPPTLLGKRNLLWIQTSAANSVALQLVPLSAQVASGSYLTHPRTKNNKMLSNISVKVKYQVYPRIKNIRVIHESQISRFFKYLNYQGYSRISTIKVRLPTYLIYHVYSRISTIKVIHESV